MAIYKLDNNKIVQLQETNFINERISEAKDLQKFIINSIETVDKDLFVLSSEFGDWEDSRRRIDILCIDKDANLVVIELKRTEDGGHMELQAIRYAAMIANMTFDKAVKAHEAYLRKNQQIETNATEAILQFLQWDSENEDEFASDVRIILVSQDFSKEVTTSVLWLLERDIDIKCIRIKPQKDGENLYFDIQQIIPLPETADYQVKLKEKVIEQRQARKESKRDYTKFNISIPPFGEESLNKRQTMIFAISKSIHSGVNPIDLMAVTGKNRWFSVDGTWKNKKDFEANIIGKRSYDSSRWFNDDHELFHYQNKTYVFSNQHGIYTFDLVKQIFESFPQLRGEIYKNES